MPRAPGATPTSVLPRFAAEEDFWARTPHPGEPHSMSSEAGPRSLPAGTAPCYERIGSTAWRDISIVSPDAVAAPRPEFLGLGTFYKGTLAPWLEDHEGRRRR